MNSTPVQKEKVRRYFRIILWAVFLLAVFFHVAFFLYTKKYLITTGVLFIITAGILFYYLFLLLKKIFRFRYQMRNVALTVTVTVLLLAVAELAFIFTGFLSTYLEKRYKYYYESPYTAYKKSWFHVWSVDHYLETSEFRYFRKINSLGLSDKEHPVEKKPGEYRIIGLGDSFTEGDGADADSTWLKFLERSLAKQELKRPVTFMNAGVCGSDPYFEYILLKEKLLKYQPDLVLLLFNSGDIDDLLVRGGIERFQPDGTLKFNKAPAIEPLYAILHLSRPIIKKLKYDELLIRFRFKSPELKTAREQLFQSLLLFRKLSLQNHFKLIVIYHPFYKEIIEKENRMAEVTEKIRKETDLSFYNLTDYYMKEEGINENNIREYFWKYDGHHNARGYALMARGIEWILNQEGIIDSLKRN